MKTISALVLIILPGIFTTGKVNSQPMDVLVHLDDLHVTGRSGDWPDNPDVYVYMAVLHGGGVCHVTTNVITSGVCTHPHAGTTLLCKGVIPPVSAHVVVMDEDGFLRDGDDEMNAPFGIAICPPMGGGLALVPPGPHATTSISWICLPYCTGEEEAKRRNWKITPSNVTPIKVEGN